MMERRTMAQQEAEKHPAMQAGFGEEHDGMPITAQELSSELLEEAQENAQAEHAELETSIREGIAELFEDGWTAEELAALSQDEGVRADIAAGRDVVRAACMYLRRQMAAGSFMRGRPRRGGIPVARAGGAYGEETGSRIEQMSDAQFDAFSRQAREAAMMGRKVRM
ncbi:MAG: hypothetical protein IJO02_03270 [Clostridia bacterium]|nr:hypothetical protein [Clostridia bacterium]MBQ6858429.1 hypothetical protein [Clostridia bacterium]